MCVNEKCINSTVTQKKSISSKPHAESFYSVTMLQNFLTYKKNQQYDVLSKGKSVNTCCHNSRQREKPGCKNSFVCPCSFNTINHTNWDNGVDFWTESSRGALVVLHLVVRTKCEGNSCVKLNLIFTLPSQNGCYCRIVFLELTEAAACSSTVRWGVRCSDAIRRFNAYFFF